MQSIGGEALIIVLGTGGFLMCLLTLIAVLSLFRQRRAWKEHLADTHTHPPKGFSEAVKQAATPPTPPKMPIKPQPRPMPEHQRLLVREVTPDQVVIQIDPAEGPTRDQRNVQRLIAFLKDESKHDTKVS